MWLFVSYLKSLLLLVITYKLTVVFPRSISYSIIYIMKVFGDLFYAEFNVAFAFCHGHEILRS